MAFKVDEVFADFRLRFGSAQRDARRIGNTMRGVGRASGAAADAQDRMARSTRKAGTAARSTTKDLKKMGKGAGFLKGQFKSLIVTMLGIEAARRAIRAVMGAFLGFQERMNNVRAITNATDADFRRLTATAKELGRTTQFTARDSAEAMTFLARTGLDVNQVLGVLPGTLNLAAAAAVDLGTAADISTNILKGMGLEVEDLDGLVDVLAKTTNSANVDLFELGDAMKVAAPIAAAAGVEVEELAGLLGVLGDAGIKSSLAGTSVRRMLINLTTGAGAAGPAIERLGLTTRDAEGNFVGLTNILRQLEGQVVSDADLFDLFGARALAAAQVLRRKGAAGIDEFTESLRDAAGTAERMRTQQMAGLVGSAKRLKSAAEGTAIAWGDALAPALSLVADVIRLGVLLPLRAVLLAFKMVGPAAFVMVEAIILGFNTLMRGVGIAAGFIIEKLGSLVRFVGELGERFGVLEGLASVLADTGASMERFGARTKRGATDQAGMNAEMARFQAAIAGARAEMGEIIEDFTGMGDEADETAKSVGALADQVDDLARRAASAGVSLDLVQFDAQLAAIRTRLREEGGLGVGIGGLDIQQQLALQRELAEADAERAADLGKLIAAERELAAAVQAVADAQKALNEATTAEDALEATQALSDAVASLGKGTRNADAAMTDFGKGAKKGLGALVNDASIVVRAVNRIADSFGLVNDDIRRAIDSALDLLRAIEAINKAKKLGEGISLAGAAGAIGAGVGLAASAISFIGGMLGGESAAEKRAREQREVMRKNTAAVRLLTDSLGNLLGAIGGFTGREIALARGAAEVGLAGGLPLFGGKEALRVMEALGIEGGMTAENLQLLLNALEEFNLSNAADDFTVALALLRQEFEMFDIEDPAEQLEKMLELFSDFTDLPPELAAAMAGLDLSKAEDRARLEEMLQDLFMQIASGQLDVTALGGLTLEEFLAALQQMEGLLDDIAEGTEDVEGETESFVRSSRITEIQGSRLLAQGDTQIVRLTQIRDLLAGGAGPNAIPAPGPGAIPGAGGQGGPEVITVTVESIQVGPIAAGDRDADAFARDVADRMAAELDRALEDLRTGKRRSDGLGPED